MGPEEKRKAVVWAYHVAIVGVVFLSWYVPPAIVADLQHRLDQTETENMEIHARVKVLEKQLKYIKEHCPNGDE